VQGRYEPVRPGSPLCRLASQRPHLGAVESSRRERWRAATLGSLPLSLAHRQVVGGGGANGFITVTATSAGSPVGSSPDSSGGGGSGGDSASPAGSGGSGANSSSPAGSGGGDGSATASGPTASAGPALDGPALDGYGSAFCSNGAGSTCTNLLGGSAVPDPTSFLNASAKALCGLGTAAACPTPGAPTAPAAPGAPVAPAPAPPPPPSPVVVAQLAISQLNLTAATPHVSANPNAAVGLPVWMWVDRSPRTTGPVSTTATAGATTVTAVASVARVDWSMGPPGAVVSCAGPGTPAPAGPIFRGNTSPDCGYSYALRSLPARTGGIGKWPVTATAVWTITWFGGGQAGGQGLNLTATTAVEVGELQAVFVAPGGGS